MQGIISSRPSLHFAFECQYLPISSNVRILLISLLYAQTSLLKALMGEFPLTSGTVRCSSSLAYVPQSPWIFSSTLKQNILFGLEFDSERYYRVLKACALDQVSDTIACSRRVRSTR